MRLDNFIIEPAKPAHLSWWAEYFEIPTAALLAAIDAVGVRALDVQRYLHSQAAAPSRASPVRTEEEQS